MCFVIFWTALVRYTWLSNSSRFFSDNRYFRMILVSMADIIGSYERLPNDAVRAVAVAKRREYIWQSIHNSLEKRNPRVLRECLMMYILFTGWINHCIVENLTRKTTRQSLLTSQLSIDKSDVPSQSTTQTARKICCTRLGKTAEPSSRIKLELHWGSEMFWTSPLSKLAVSYMDQVGLTYLPPPNTFKTSSVPSCTAIPFSVNCRPVQILPVRPWRDLWPNVAP